MRGIGGGDFLGGGDFFMGGEFLGGVDFMGGDFFGGGGGPRLSWGGGGFVTASATSDRKEHPMRSNTANMLVFILVK